VNERRILQEYQRCYQEEEQLERTLGEAYRSQHKNFCRPRCAIGVTLRIENNNQNANQQFEETANENPNGTPETTVAARQWSVFRVNQARVFR
jgi:hypothetical protein